MIDNETVLKCERAAGCRIKPCWTFTPIWYELSPAVVYPGQHVTLIIDPKKAPRHQFDSTFIHMIDVKLDDHQIDMRKFMDEEE